MDFIIEVIFKPILLILLVIFLIFQLIGLVNMIESKTYYYTDNYGIEHEVDYCDSSYGSFYCHDYNKNTKFKVDSYRYDFKELK